MFHPNDMIQLNNFDGELLKINERENRENNNIYYISYKINKPEHDINSINNLYLVVDHMYGKIEKINDSKDRYLVINNDNHMNKENIHFFCLWDYELLDLIAQVMPTPCTSATTLPPSSSMLCILFSS